MKTTTLLALLMVLVLQTIGQNVSILDSSLKWNIGINCVNEGPWNPYDKWATTFQHTEDDTLMNDKHYKRLISCSDSLCRKQSLKAFIREEAGRVYLANKTEELLQFDFNLQKGDTMIMQLFKVGDFIPKYYIQIDSVKNLLWPDQKKRIVQYVTILGSMPDILVEGIGSLTFGIQYPSDLLFTGGSGCWPHLLCFYSGKSLIYDNPEFNNCYLSTGLQQLLKQPELVQVLNSNHGLLELQLAEAKAGKLFVFDIEGKLIIGQSVNQSGTQCCLPSSGIYLYRFVSDEGKVQNGKVLVK